MLTFVPLAGFLGAGKTTTLISAAVALQRSGRRVAAITSDQGLDLVDTQLARGAVDEVAEVAGGCFCRRFDELAALVADLAGSGRADVVLAEAVGSCCDLRGAVLSPLRQRFGRRIRIAPLTVLVDPARLAAFPDHARPCQRGGPCAQLRSLFRCQLAEADVLALNKTELLGPQRTAELVGRLAAAYPAAVQPYSALTGDGLDALLARVVPSRRGIGKHHALDTAARQTVPLIEEESCDQCCALGGKLAGMNQSFQVHAIDASFDAVAWGGAALRYLSDWCARSGILLGHAKVTVRTASGMAKLSVTEPGVVPRADRTAAGPVGLGAATLNVRAACQPAALGAAVSNAVRAADTVAGTVTSAAAHVPFEAECPASCCVPLER